MAAFAPLPVALIPFGGILSFLAVTVVAFAGLVLLASHLRFTRLAEQAAAGPSDELDTREVFELQIVNRLRALAGDRSPFLVLVAQPSDSMDPAPPSEGPLARLETTLRKALRSSDDVVPYHAQQVGAVVDASRADAENIAQRLLHRIGSEIPRPPGATPGARPVRIGLAACPESGERMRVLVEAAEAALTLARDSQAGAWALAPFLAPAPALTARVEARPPTDAHLDPVTGVLREETLPSSLQKYVARFRKDNHPIAVVSFEVDAIPRYTEHYGQEGANQLLSNVAFGLVTRVRRGDLVGRMGESEFVVAMPCPCGEALRVAERLVDFVRRAVFMVGSSGLKISMRAGVAGYPEHGGVPRQLLEKARLACLAARASRGQPCLKFLPSMKAPTLHDRPADRL